MNDGLLPVKNKKELQQYNDKKKLLRADYFKKRAVSL